MKQHPLDELLRDLCRLKNKNSIFFDIKEKIYNHQEADGHILADFVINGHEKFGNDSELAIREILHDLQLDSRLRQGMTLDDHLKLSIAYGGPWIIYALHSYNSLALHQQFNTLKSIVDLVDQSKNCGQFFRWAIGLLNVPKDNLGVAALIRFFLENQDSLKNADSLALHGLLKALELLTRCERQETTNDHEEITADCFIPPS